MKTLLLTGIAALFLATGTAHAEQTKAIGSFDVCNEILQTAEAPTPEQVADYKRCKRHYDDAKWEVSERHCHARKLLGSLELGWGDDKWGEEVAVHLDDIRELEKLIPQLKKCEAFWQCVADRDAGKVKHCYANDRRWR